MIVVIEVVSVVGEIGFNDVGPAVVVVIGGIDPHARLFATVGAVGHTRFRTHFGEVPLAVVVIEQARGRIIGHV